MKIPSKSFATGIIAGVLSWLFCRIVSDRFEPFDTAAGLLIGQFLLSIISFFTGYQHGFKALCFLLLGVHVSQNSYAYIFGGSESRAWFILGVFTTMVFLIVPFFLGSVGIVISRRSRKS